MSAKAWLPGLTAAGKTDPYKNIDIDSFDGLPTRCNLGNLCPPIFGGIMLYINKLRRVIIREAAKELRKKMAPNLDYYDEHPWKFMPEYEMVMNRVCKTKDEEAYFEWIFIFGSDKAARKARFLLQGYRDGKKAQAEEPKVHEA